MDTFFLIKNNVVLVFGQSRKRFVIMAPRELVFCNYNSRFLDDAVMVVKEEIEVGDVYILGDRRRPGCYPEVVEVRVMSVNINETVTVIVRVGGVENVIMDNLRQLDWYKKPLYWLSGGPRGIPHYRRPLFKDDMLTHGVEVTRVVNYDLNESESDESESEEAERNDERPDYMFEDFLS